jgi:hypothetical protein
MDAHTESVAEALPDMGDFELGQDSFESSLEEALNVLNAPETEQPTEEYSEEPQEEYEEESEEAPEEEYDPIEDLEEEVGDWTPKAAKRFQELKAELKTLKPELEHLRQAKVDYERQLSELQAVAESKEVEELQAKLAEYERHQTLNDLESTTAFQQAVTQPMAALMSQAEQIADKYDVDPNALIDVISLSDPQAQEDKLAELLPDATDRDRAKLFRIMEDVEPLLERRNAMLQNAQEALAEARQLEEQQAQQELVERTRMRQNITRNVVERVQQKLPFLANVEGLDLATIEKRAAASDPTTVHPVDHAYQAVASQLLPTIVKEYASLRKELDVLTSRLADYESAEPTLTGSARQDSLRRGPESANMSFEERISAMLSSV